MESSSHAAGPLLAVDQATAGYDVAFSRLVPAAGSAGFDVVDVAVHHIPGDGRMIDLLARHGVRVGQLSCGIGVPADISQATAPAALDKWEQACCLAHELGASLSLYVPAGSDARLVETRLAALHRRAALHAVQVNVELHDAALVTDAGRWWRCFTDRYGAGIGLLLDTATWARHHRDPAAAISALPRGSIGWVQIADLAEPGRKVLPGAGHLDLAGMVTACSSIGYRGPLAVEVPASPGTDLQRRLGHAATALRNLLTALPREPR